TWCSPTIPSKKSIRFVGTKPFSASSANDRRVVEGSSGKRSRPRSSRSPEPRTRACDTLGRPRPRARSCLWSFSREPPDRGIGQVVSPEIGTERGPPFVGHARWIPAGIGQAGLAQRVLVGRLAVGEVLDRETFGAEKERDVIGRAVGQRSGDVAGHP